MSRQVGPRRPRRPRAQIDADNLDEILSRWNPYITEAEYDAGQQLLHALRELERQIPERVDQWFWRR
jgi:hypothetical protein